MRTEWLLVKVSLLSPPLFFSLSLSLQSISGSHEFLSTLVNPFVFKSIYVQDYFLISITRESKIYKFPSMAN